MTEVLTLNIGLLLLVMELTAWLWKIMGPTPFPPAVCRWSLCLFSIEFTLF